MRETTMTTAPYFIGGGVGSMVVTTGSDRATIGCHHRVSSLRVKQMKWPYLEVTFRNGRPLAAYLYLPRSPGDRMLECPLTARSITSRSVSDCKRAVSPPQSTASRRARESRRSASLMRHYVAAAQDYRINRFRGRLAI
jgi:hypothetical protein